MTDDTERLLAENATLRDEGLRMMDGWDAERRETRRLEAMVVRFRTRAQDLESDLDRLEEEHVRTLESLERLRGQEVELTRSVDLLRNGLRVFGRHADRCPAAAPTKSGTACACGFGALLGEEEPAQS